MRRDGIVWSCLVAGCLLAVAPGAYGAPDREAGDAAFDAGASERALALYDEILAANPSDINALLRSGKLLSWDRKYDEALARYDRALAREPENVDVLLERGKVLLWSQRYDEAILAFDRVSALAPNEPWALCGTAQAYAWRGRGKEARPFYERALAAAPGMKEALLGLAYLDLADGDAAKAALRVAVLRAKDPADPEVVTLVKEVRRARAPWVQIGWDGSEDSDDNAIDTYRAEGGVALPARMDLRFGYAHTALHGPDPTNLDLDGRADALYGVLLWQSRPGQRGELRLGATRLTDSRGGERTTGIGGLAITFPLAGWAGRAAIARDPFLYSPRILDNAIDITSLTFGVSGMASSRVRVEANAGYGDFSDGNARLSADGSVWPVWKWPRRSLLAGVVVRYLDYAEDRDNGYFDPSRLIAALLSARSYGSIGASRWEYEATAEAGVQWFTLEGVTTDHEPLWNVFGLVARPLPHGVSFQLFAGFGNSSTASGPGFKSRSGGLRLRFTIGG